MDEYTLYQPTGSKDADTPKATLLVVHGMADHQNRYIDFAQFMANQGIAIMTFDNIGHGQAAYDNNTLGYIGSNNPDEKMIAHTLKYADILAEKYPTTPHFILGFSMGSFITRILLNRHSEKFAGAILIGTASSNLMTTSFTQLTQSLNFFFPKIYNPFLHHSIGLLFNLPFLSEKNLGWLNWLNSDPNEVEKYIADPLCDFCFTNNGYYALMQLMAKATEYRWSADIAKDKPMLFLSGEDDTVGQMGRSLPIIADDLRIQGFTQVTTKQYAKMRHEILKEPNYLQVYSDIINWLELNA